MKLTIELTPEQEALLTAQAGAAGTVTADYAKMLLTSQISEKPVQNLMVEIACAELAAVTAALKFWGGWVQSADQYAQKISTELAKTRENGAVSNNFGGKLTDFTREYLREITTLPNLAVQHFASELDNISKPPVNRSRKARAKE